MQFHPNELMIIYDSATNSGKQTKAYAYSVSNHVNDVDYNRTRVSKLMWKEIINMLNIPPKRLLNKADPKYQEKVRGHAYTMEGWLNVLYNNPDLIRAPIVIRNKKAVLCEKPSDIFKLA
ncbi:glutaredoxin [Mangrovivirga sp. M17]|nr:MULTISPECIES: ArsC/Spx/MgsR family protein [Mangrovivirga]MCX2744363.1 glutaredoxin [Mangrovivirga halotolerans]